MADKFEFDHIGKRLPYTMPPETYNEMEANVLATLKQSERTDKLRSLFRWSMISGIAVAACVTFLLAIVPAGMSRTDSMAQIDNAFANLSESDQAFLIEIYQEDIFLTQE